MDKSNFDMNQVLTLLKNLNAKYINGFFSHRDIDGKEIFRIASGINPGSSNQMLKLIFFCLL